LNPSEHTGERLPVTNVTWSEVKEFIARLNRELGLGERHGYRLPSEAEWEYATRAGTLTQFAFGDSIRPDIVNYDWRRSFGPTEVDKVKIATVGSLGFANAWGLFDMHGNVMEWCEDDWHPDYVGAPADGRPWITEAGNRGRDRVIRGGGYEDIAKSCRSAARYAENANTNKDYIGFRLARPHLK
jgi:formylglycine-generating enzyme required for sulfatase activity